MLLQFQEHLSKNLPFLKDKKLLLAISGGIDSMVLVHLLHQLNCNIAIAHCNFTLRGEESEGDEQFIRIYAEKNNIPFFVTHFDTKLFAADNKLSIQLAARQLRYIWFHQLLEENQMDYILTAHHLDDSLETFLINFTRGTGPEGLTGIPQQNDKVVRPLLPFTRDEIEAYAKENNIHWREDSSNASDKYMRNKLRHDVVPVLKSLNPSFMESFGQTLEHLQQAQSLVSGCIGTRVQAGGE
jgi:tRNA(Ile)-lysidine synthase